MLLFFSKNFTGDNLHGLYIGVSSNQTSQHSYSETAETYSLCSYYSGIATVGEKVAFPCVPENINGSYVIIQKMGYGILALCEIEVYEGK